MAAAPANSRPRRVIGLDTSHRLNVTLPSARIPPLPNIGRRLKQRPNFDRFSLSE